MNARLMFFVVGCAAIAATGCHRRIMHPLVPGSATVTITAQGNTASVDQPDLKIADKDFSSEIFTVRWKPPEGSQFWLVQFDPNDTPCEQPSFIIQKGGQEQCVIRLGSRNVKPGERHYYKYIAFADAAHTEDPGIAHNTGAAQPSPKPITLFCLDLKTGSPASCNNGDHPTPSEDASSFKVSPLDDIYFQGVSGWSVAMPAGVCYQAQISSSSQPYCTIKATPSTYSYHVTVNGTTKGPFQIQVQ